MKLLFNISASVSGFLFSVFPFAFLFWLFDGISGDSLQQLIIAIIISSIVALIAFAQADI